MVAVKRSASKDCTFMTQNQNLFSSETKMNIIAQDSSEEDSSRQLLSSYKMQQRLTSNNCRKDNSKSKDKAKCVRREYRDYASIDEETFNRVHLPVLKKTKRKTAGGVVEPFPEKLHDMLNEETEYSTNPSIISWLPHGRAFKIHKPDEFARTSLSHVFKHTKLNSFLRQINLYGFYRINFGPDQGAYYHELFLRDRKFLTRAMSRIKVNGRRNVGSRDPKDEPDFYAMPFVGASATNSRMNAPIPLTTKGNSLCLTPPPAFVTMKTASRFSNEEYASCSSSSKSLMLTEEPNNFVSNGKIDHLRETVDDEPDWWYDTYYQCWRLGRPVSVHCDTPVLENNSFSVVTPGTSSSNGNKTFCSHWYDTREHDLPPLPLLGASTIFPESSKGPDVDDTTALINELKNLTEEFPDTFEPIPIAVCCSSSSTSTYDDSENYQGIQEAEDDILMEVLSADLFQE